MKEVIINSFSGKKILLNLSRDTTYEILINKICKKIKVNKNNFFLSINNRRVEAVDQIFCNKNFVIDIIPYKKTSIYCDNGNMIKTIII